MQLQAASNVHSPATPSLTTNAASVPRRVDLLTSCEWLLRRRLRHDWALLCRADQTQVLALVSHFARGAPFIDAATLAADAAAWTLYAMYWCGTSHPAALFQKPLHPPTEVVRWISQFHIEQQMTLVRDIQRHFVANMAVTSNRCGSLVRKMIKRTGRVALMPELCNF